jgi:hypothetical protein
LSVSSLKESRAAVRALHSLPHKTDKGRTPMYIVKDALKAFALWVVASLLLAVFFGQSGVVFSQALGFILVVSFIVLRSAELLRFILLKTGLGRAGGTPLPQAAYQSGGSGSSGSAQPPCHQCGGSGRMTCPSCRGMRGSYSQPQTAAGSSQWVPCPMCIGSGTVQCTSSFGHF